MTIPLYYELYDFLYQGANREEIFADLDYDIATAIYQGLIKYQKYYTFMDNTDTYYTVLILDPRVKGNLLLRELSDNTGQMIIDTIRNDIYKKYAGESKYAQSGISSTTASVSYTYSDPETRMLQRLTPVIKKPAGSDIDDYFTTSRIVFEKLSGDPTWLIKWWYTYYNDMPQMAAAARDYLAIPVSEVAVERLFSQARDLLAIRRYSMNSETMRMLMLLEDIV